MISSATEMVIRHGVSMRKFFDFKQYKLQSWFPGHMNKGLVQMQTKLKKVDCIVEIHDARIALTGRNPIFYKNLGRIRPYILVMNKVDLIPKKYERKIYHHFQEQGLDVIFTNCKEQKNRGIKQLLPRAKDVIERSNKFGPDDNLNYSLMIIGIPNVGKSSIINALRVKNLKKGGKATPVGQTPGVTRSVMERIKVSEDPPIYLYDTPGVLTPQIRSNQTGLKLALTNTIKDHLIEHINIADFLLFKLNYSGNFKYVDYLKIESPTDDINQLLLDTCISQNLSKRLKVHSSSTIDNFPDMTAAANYFIKGYRDGVFGYVDIDNYEERFFSDETNKTNSDESQFEE